VISEPVSWALDEANSASVCAFKNSPPLTAATHQGRGEGGSSWWASNQHEGQPPVCQFAGLARLIHRRSTEILEQGSVHGGDPRAAYMDTQGAPDSWYCMPLHGT